ncbi:MAG: hypothetical protein ABJE95_05055 [Byssovorax sp.]
MNHASLPARSRRSSRCRSSIALVALSAIAASSTLLAAAPAAADPAPWIGYAYGSWPSPTRFEGSTDSVTTPARPPPDAVTERAPKDEGGPSLDLGCATEVPLMVGGQLTLELPYRILLQGEVGVLPAAYVNGIDSVLTGAGAYDATTSALVRSTLQSSLVVRASAGFRPFSTHGLEIMGGYTLTSLGGGVSARTAVEAAAGIAVPAEIPDAEIQLRTTIHSLHVSLGWRWIVGDHFVVRASLAYLQAVGSSSSLAVPAGASAVPGVTAKVDQISQAVDTTLNSTYTKYAKLPVIGLSLGYRF